MDWRKRDVSEKLTRTQPLLFLIEKLADYTLKRRKHWTSLAGAQLRSSEKQRIAVEELKDEDALVALDGSIVPVTRADADIEDYLPKAKDGVTQKKKERGVVVA